MSKIIAYLRESWEELKKVAWPTKHETIAYTGLVILMSVALAAFLGAVDYVFTWGLEKLVVR